MTIIKTLLLTAPHYEWTARTISDFINTHKYNIVTEVNPRTMAQTIRNEKNNPKSYLYGIKAIKIEGNRYRYTMEEKQQW